MMYTVNFYTPFKQIHSGQEHKQKQFLFGQLQESKLTIWRLLNGLSEHQ